LNVIEFRDIVWRRGTDTILQHVDWTVAQDQHWAIIGCNGSGKTSLLRMLCGYIWPTSGTITVLGHRFGTVDLRELRKSIGLVSSAFQEQLQSFHPRETALDVVLSGKFSTIGVYDEVYEDDVDRAADLLARFGAADLADRTFNTLSQGEKQRVLLARAWMGRPRILILDEPCTGLDVLAREHLLQAIQVLGQSEDAPTLLYVTHHIEELLPLFSHVLLLKHGRVVASGEKPRVVTEPLLSEAFSIPVEITWQDDRPWLRVASGAGVMGAGAASG
jgi:iron complex transport system ATP-binding protein